MIRLNIHEVKTHLSRYLADLSQGNVILICKHNVPIAEIRPLPAKRKTKRPLGVVKSHFTVPPEFFEPLPEEMLDAFEGKVR